MKTEHAFIHVPAGCTMLAGPDVDSLVDMGIIPEETDSNIAITYDVARIQGSKGEQVVNYIRNMVATATTALYQLNLENIGMLAGGVFNTEKVAGSQVTGEVHEVSAWEKETFIQIPGQNSDGSAQTITTVENGVTELEEGVDYVAAKVGGRWGIIILSGSSAVTSSPIKITYTYTPTASLRATMGDGNLSIKACVVRFEKEIEGKRFAITLYKAVKTDGITLSFPAITSEAIPSIDVQMEGRLDTSRAAGDQLLEIIDEIGEY